MAAFRRHDRRRRRRDQGIALITVLWFVMLLALISAGFLAVSRGGIRAADAGFKRARAEALANDGVALGIMALLEPGLRDGLRTDGVARVIRRGADRLSIAIQDVGGRIDLNEADESLLTALFRSVGAPESRAKALAHAIAERRGAEGERWTGASGVAEFRATTLSEGQGPGKRPFYAVSELRQVAGMDRALYEKVAPSLTVRSGSPDVDTAVAPPSVQAALRLAGIAVDTGQEAASPHSGNPVSASARPLGWGGSESPLPPSETDTYAIRAEAVLAGGGRFVRDAVVILTGDDRDPYRIQAWGTPGG